MSRYKVDSNAAMPRAESKSEPKPKLAVLPRAESRAPVPPMAKRKTPAAAPRTALAHKVSDDSAEEWKLF
jgi:hypothetical protein